MYDYTRHQALKMNIRDIVPNDKDEEALAFIKNAFKGGMLNSLETERKTKDGKTIKVWMMGTVIRDEKDNIDGIATIERNIAAFPGAGTKSQEDD